MKTMPSPVLDIENLCAINCKAPDLTEDFRPYTSLDEGTVIIRFRNYEMHSGGASLLSFINNQYPASYFTIYIVMASMVGIVKKVISKDQSDFHTTIVNADETVQVNMINTLAVRIRAGRGYSVFLNGRLVVEKPDPSACFLSDISLRGRIETVLAGKMLDAQKMKQREMLYHGDIDFIKLYDQPLSDECLCAITGQTVPDFRVRVPDGGRLSAPVQLCYKGYQGANNFRIPIPMRTQKGTLLVTFDKMFFGLQDHPNRNHLMMRRSEDGGRTWKHAQTLLKFPGNAQAIDSCLLQDRDTGRIFLITTTFPENVTTFNSDNGVGYVREDGVIKRILVDDAGQRYLVEPDGSVTFNGQPTGYTTVKGGTELYLGEKFLGYTHMEKTMLRLPRISFLMMMHSDDDGLTWSEPIDLNALLKKEWMHFWGCGPGTGIQLKHGPHKGRLLLQTYCFNKHSIESPMFIYSDDHGETWQMGETINDNRLYDGKLWHGSTVNNWEMDCSESQPVELPNGTVQLFCKNFRGPDHCILIATSRDGGETFDQVLHHDLALHSTYCMSVIEWPVPINGETAYIYSSADTRAGNYNGAVKIGYYRPDENGGHIEWKHSRLIKPGIFGYCFLCSVDEDTLGIAYESSGALHLSFQTMNLAFLLSDDDRPLVPVRLRRTELMPKGNGTRITLCFNQLVMISGDRTLYAQCGEEWLPAAYCGRSEDSRCYDFWVPGVKPEQISETALSAEADVATVNGMLYHYSHEQKEFLWQYYNKPYVSLKGSGAV